MLVVKHDEVILLSSVLPSQGNTITADAAIDGDDDDDAQHGDDDNHHHNHHHHYHEDDCDDYHNSIVKSATI